MSLFREDFIEWIVAAYQKILGVPFEYNNTMEVWNRNKEFNSNCAVITFVNQGTSQIIINQSLKLAPGAAVSFDGEKNEKDTTLYRVTFVNSGHTENEVCVIKKYYNRS